MCLPDTLCHDMDPSHQVIWLERLVGARRVESSRFPMAMPVTKCGHETDLPPSLRTGFLSCVSRSGSMPSLVLRGAQILIADTRISGVRGVAEIVLS